MTTVALNSETRAAGPWPHRIALLFACATFPLLWVGGLVTSSNAGMAVPDWPTTYGQNMFLYSWIERPWDIFIEHSHRLLGATVGLLAIGLVIATWLSNCRTWIRVAAIVALAMVCSQGILGGMRVRMDERDFARLHGCFGPLVFAMAVALVAFTSRWWSAAVPRTDQRAGGLQRLAIATTIIAYVQLVLGALVRHIPDDAAPATFRMYVIFHLIMAAALTVHVLWLAACVVRGFRGEPLLLRPTLALAALILIQLGLGAGTYLTHYGPPSWLARYDWAASYTIQAQSLTQLHITTAHVAAGSLIFVTALVVTLRSLRLFNAMPTRRTSSVETRLPVLEVVR